jgi:hypothetical protein
MRLPQKNANHDERGEAGDRHGSVTTLVFRMAVPVALRARGLRIIRFDEWRPPPSPWNVDKRWIGKGDGDVARDHPRILPRAETVGTSTRQSILKYHFALALLNCEA